MNGLVAVFAAMLLSLAFVDGAAAASPEADLLSPYVAAISAQLDPRVAPTLMQLDGAGRRLLALRSYLRSGSGLAARWSWNQQQIESFEGSAEQRELQQEIERVRATFVAANPGFDVRVNPQVRSLDRQIDSWNVNATVKAAAQGISANTLAMMAEPGFTALRPEQRNSALKAWLSAYRPSPTPTVAAPGLSLHGQMRAIDFQVWQGARVVAGPSTATIARDWVMSGWAAKLSAAVHSASRRFVGPLESPQEPWHFTYAP